ncbi:MAG: TlpA disulfide reductase family protein [Ignavibacteriales bacterium]|nr:TlpA disulfide reductase family protein [Ignavibacteriales bacterium]
MIRFISLLMIILLFNSANVYPQRSEKITVETIDKTKLTKLIKDRKGKILFLNLWATWCVPCREEFPSIVKLADEMKDVEFVGISIDFPDEVDSKIIPFLKSNKVNFTNYVNGFSGDEELINALDKKWNGALPATFIFDTKGNKKVFLSGSKSYEEFKKVIGTIKK